MQQNQERTRHTGHQVDAKPMARPPSILADAFLYRIDKDQQRRSQTNPSRQMSLPAVREGRGLTDTEEGLDDPCCRNSDRHGKPNDDQAAGENRHFEYFSTPLLPPA